MFLGYNPRTPNEVLKQTVKGAFFRFTNMGVLICVIIPQNAAGRTYNTCTFLLNMGWSLTYWAI